MSDVEPAVERALGVAEGTDLASPLRARAVGAGLVSNEALRADRMTRDEVEGLDFFEVTLRQPLDPAVWLTYPARLVGQELTRFQGEEGA